MEHARFDVTLLYASHEEDERVYRLSIFRLFRQNRLTLRKLWGDLAPIA